MKYVLSLLVVGVGSVAFAGNACTPIVSAPVNTGYTTVALPVSNGACGVFSGGHQKQVLLNQSNYNQQALAAAQYRQALAAAQYQQALAAAQHQQLLAAQQNNVRGNGRVRGNGNGGAFVNTLNSIFSPQGILTIGGAAAGAALAGPLGAPAGAAIGATLGTVLGNGFGGNR